MSKGIKEKLVAIQQELKAPKGQYNSFGKYKYRSCEDILEAVKPLLAKNKVALTLGDDIVAVGDRIYVKAVATLEDAEGDGILVNTAWAREDEAKKGMDGSQITGTASSYARKYCLNGLFLIDDTKDADTDSYHKVTADTVATEVEKKTFLKRCELDGVDYKEVGKRAGAHDLKSMTADQMGKALIILGEIEESKGEA